MVGFFRAEAEKSPHQGVAGVVAVGLGRPVDPLALALQGGAGLVHRPDKLGHRHFFQLLGVLFVDLKGLQNLQHQLLGGTGGVKIPGGDNAGHDDHLLEQVLGLGNLPQHGDLGAAAGLAEDGDVLRVAPKAGDVLLHPAQGLHQIGHAHIYAVPVFLPEIEHVQIAEGVQAVIDRHHQAVLLGQVEAVVAHLLDGGTGGVPAPVNPEQHRLFGGGVAVVRPHVQVLAVLRRGPEPVGRHVPHLRHVDHLGLVGVGGRLQERRHVGVGATEAVLDVVIPLGQAPLLFHHQDSGLQGVPVGFPVGPHLGGGVGLPAHFPQHLVRGKDLPVHGEAAGLDLA